MARDEPDNVFLVPDAAAPFGARVCLLDFGIAKLTSGLADDHVHTASDDRHAVLHVAGTVR